MKRFMFAAIAGAAATVSMAQTSGIQTPTNLAFRLGGAYSIDASTRDFVKTFIGVGADIFLQKSLLPGNNTETTVSLDWLGKSGSGAKGNMFPLMINQRWYSVPTGGALDQNRFYYFGGLGVAIIDISTTKTVFAARGGVGYEFNRNVFAEAVLLYTEPANKIRGSAIGAYIGYRF